MKVITKHQTGLVYIKVGNSQEILDVDECLDLLDRLLLTYREASNVRGNSRYSQNMIKSMRKYVEERIAIKAKENEETGDDE